MSVSINDISFVLSGGSTNNDPNKSLGGLPSNMPIIGDHNNLFANVELSNTFGGRIDYRCFYVFNDSDDSSLFDTKIYLENQAGGSVIELGITQATDLQRITVSDTVSSGSATLLYEGEPVVWTYNADLETWASNLETGLNSLGTLSGVSVSTTEGSGVIDFYVSFDGDDDNRNHELIQIMSDNFTPGGIESIVKVTEGSPINAVAPKIAVDTATPVNVQFSSPTDESPIEIGTLLPGDGVPVWIKRIVSVDAESFQNDGFSFKLIGSPF